MKTLPVRSIQMYVLGAVYREKGMEGTLKVQ
jgi:hypothetical protein